MQPEETTMPGKPEVDVALFGGEPQIRRALESILHRFRASIHCFQESEQCLQALPGTPCNLLILDFDGHAAEALDVLVGARGLSPQIPRLVLVDHGDIPAAVRAMKAGATNCLEKPIESDRLLSAIEVEFCHRPEPELPSCRALTKTETEVLNLVLTGRTTAEVATVLHRSKRTIEVHRRNIMRKLQATSVVDLVRRAVKMGLVDLEAWGRTCSD